MPGATSHLWFEWIPGVYPLEGKWELGASASGELTEVWLDRMQLFSRLLNQPMDFFDEHESGQLTSRLGTDCQTVSRCLATNFNVAVRNSLQFLGTYLLWPSLLS